jgi:hypothetical protein
MCCLSVAAVPVELFTAAVVVAAAFLSCPMPRFRPELIRLSSDAEVSVLRGAVHRAKIRG